MDPRILKLTQSSAIYGIGNMLQRFAGLLLLPLFTRHLTTAEYGVYALLTILGALVQPIFELGMSAAIGPSYFKGKDRRDKDSVIWNALLISSISATILLLVIWTMPELAPRLALIGDEYAYAASLFLTGIAANIVLTPLAQKLQFEQRAKSFVATRLSGTLAFALISAFTVVVLDRGVLGMVEAQAAGYLLSFVLFFIFARPKGRLRTDWSILKAILKTGLPMVPSFAFLFIMANAGRYALQFYAGESAVGTYSVGFQVGTAINILISALATAWYPFFMGYIDKREDAAIFFGKLTAYYVLSVGLICLSIFAFADVLIYYFVDDAFYDARKVVGLISLAFACTGLFNLFLPPVYFHGRVFMVAPIQVGAAALAILLAVSLCPWLGLSGAALSMFGGHAAMAAGLYLYNRQSQRLTFEIKYNWRRLLRFGLAALLIIVLSLYEASPQTWIFFLKPLVLISASIMSVWTTLAPSERRAALSFLTLRLSRFRRS